MVLLIMSYEGERKFSELLIIKKYLNQPILEQRLNYLFFFF
jgi:hypothetical protein